MALWDDATTNQITQTNTQSLGNSHQRVKGDRFDAALHSAQIDWVQISLLSQSFLAHSGALSVHANILA